MAGWYEPDKIWALFGIRTVEQYAEKMVVEGHFHVGIPEDIIESFRTAEYLMAHAYYHWPMYDEAARKLTGIFEMAIKMRCDELGLPLFYHDKKGKKRKYTLSKLIEQLDKKEPGKKLKNKLDWFREIRNHLAHPSQHSFMGGNWKNKIMDGVNLINLLFLEEKEIIATNQQLEFYKKEFSAFQKGHFILENNGQRILSRGAYPLEAFKINEEWISIWHIKRTPLNFYDQLSEEKYDQPLLLNLKGIKLNGNTFEAIHFETSEPIQLYSTDQVENMEKFKAFEKEWSRLADDQKLRYEMHLNVEQYNWVRDFVYGNRWTN